MTSGLKRLLRSAAAIAAALMLVPQANAAGGTMRYAAVSEPAPLDVMLTTAGVTLVVGMHIFEALYTLDSHFEPQPMLAESEKVEDGGKTIIIKLREGVHFHNGKEMTSDDVVASMNRWAKYGVRGKLLFVEGATVEASGKYEITLKLPQPNGAWKNLLGSCDGGQRSGRRRWSCDAAQGSRALTIDPTVQKSVADLAKLHEFERFAGLQS